METRKKHALLIIALMAVAAAILALTQPAREVTDPGIRADLPDVVGPYRGLNIRYCQNDDCPGAGEPCAETGDLCPRCGGGLGPMSLAERTSLPPGTEIRKKVYADASGRTLSVSVVFSGIAQKSIHRPQQCLPAQGYAIERRTTAPVPLPGRSPLKVAWLDLRKTASTPRGQAQGRLSCCAYWFVSRDEETPYHLDRLYRMSVDRIFGREVPRWAYIAILTDRRDGSDEHVRRISDFIKDFYPLIRKPSGAAGAP